MLPVRTIRAFRLILRLEHQASVGPTVDVVGMMGLYSLLVVGVMARVLLIQGHR